MDTFFDIMPQPGGCDRHNDYVYSEIMLGRRKMQLQVGMMDDIATDTCDIFHLGRSQLFKPPLTIAISLKDLQRIEPANKVRRAAIKKGMIPTVNLYVISDGRRALIRRIG
ncbi:hypothetical protein HYT02_05200 [Candidatus Gottesmanbacteria bacterium]|nr:hypothetical protein [Candidatus Gottesmanbacteria bacterium]